VIWYAWLGMVVRRTAMLDSPSRRSEEQPRLAAAIDQEFSESQAAALARMDDLAAQMIGWIMPIRFAIAHTEAEREAVYRLRYETVIDRGWLKPADLPDSRECDAYDNQAVHLMAVDGHQLAGYARLILPAPGLSLPTEQAFDLQIEPRARWSMPGVFL